MSTQLQPGADPLAAARDIFRGQIEAASDQLGDRDAPAAAVDIHSARKQLKRARATLRLLRDALGEDEYQAMNIAVRDAARPLSQVRDSEVLQEALDGVVEHGGKQAEHLRLDELRADLKRQRSHLQRTAAQRSQLSKVQESLRRVERRAHSWPLLTADYATLQSGLKRIYRRGRKAGKTARAEPSTETLHEWRKQAKYLWHQLQILEPLAPKALGELADEFHDLSDYLGDEHDLAVLHTQVSRPGGGLDSDAKHVLQRLIDYRREQLRDKAFTLGERLYADKPKDFLDHLRTSMR